MIRSILVLCFLSIFFTTIGQTNSEISSRIIGKWLIVKHTLKENGKDVNKLTSGTTFTFEFKSDGTYKNTSTYPKFGTVITTGKWKVGGGGKTIETYENKFLPPHDKDGLVADHPLNIIKLTKFEFTTNECHYSEAPPGISYYKKQ